MSSNSNPVFSDGSKWYFWDETWTQFLGPYDSESEADQAAREYVSYLDTGYYLDSLQEKEWRDGEWLEILRRHNAVQNGDTEEYVSLEGLKS